MFDLFRKLFKAFNSAQTPWQMSLALSLGMAMGLTPFSGIQTIILIFIVFIINIHLGLFFVSAGFFSGVAYLIDPVFEQLGFVILNNPGMQEFFTSAYNSGFMRLTYFNNTLVMGSTVVAFSLLIPMYFILNKVVFLYRDKIATKLSQYKIFKTLGVEVTDKKDKFLRLWAAGVFIVLGGLIVAFVFMFMDSLAKSAIESSLAKATKKNVTINDVEISFKDSKFNINGLNIYDDKESLIKSDNIGVKIDFNQILFNHYHIDNINVAGLKFNEEITASSKTTTTLSDSSSASSKTKDEETSSDDSSMLDGVSDSLPSPKTLLARSGLSSSKHVDEAKEKIKGIETKYAQAIEKDFSKQEIDSVKNELNALHKKIKSKDFSTITQDLKTIKELKKKLKEKKELATRLKKDFKKDKALVTQYTKTIKNGALSDYNNLSQNYRFDSKGGVNVVGVLFGDKVKGYSSSLLEYYEMAKPYLGSDEKEKEEPVPPRGEGRWIKYKELNNQVGMWVKNVNIDGKYDDQDFKASITNISSNQKLINQPMKLLVMSDGMLSKAVNLGISKLDDSDYSFRAVAKTFDYKTMDTAAKIKYTNTKFSSKYLKSINDFDVNIKATKEIISPKLIVTTNLDNKLKGVFKKVLKEKSEKYKKELKALIDQNAKDSIAKLTKDNAELAKIEKELGLNLSDITSSDAEVKKIEKNTKNKANEKINKAKKAAKAKVDKAKAKVKKEAQSKVKDEANKLLKSFKF